MSIRRWSLCLLFGPTTLAMAQPVPAVIDINEITNAAAPAPTRTESSLPNEIVRVGTDKAFFAATGDTNGRELWSHSPSPVLTPWDRLVGPLSADPRLLTPVGSNLYLAEKVADVNAGVLETRERVSFVSGTTVSVTKLLGPGEHVMDIAPVGSTAMFAIWAAPKTEFYRSVAAGTSATLITDTTAYLVVGDMLNCSYGASDGFLAFTSFHSGSWKLVALANTTFTNIYTGEVENLTADGTTLYFTGKDTHYRLYRWTTASLPVEVDSNLTPIRHVMPAEFGGENRIYYVKGTSTDAQVWYGHGSQRFQLDWPRNTSDVKVTASLKVGDMPHVLGTAVISGTRSWAVWRTDSNGAAMELVANLPGWGGCSQLVASGTDKLAFVGHYDAASPDLRSPRIGFVVYSSANGSWDPPTASKAMDLSEGSVPSSLVALDTRVVFSAADRLKGIEPWYCEFPQASANTLNQVMNATGAGKPSEIGEAEKPINEPGRRRVTEIHVR